MLTTDVMEWPAPVWPSWRLEESQKTLASEPSSIFHVALAWIRILSAAGDLEGARLKLAALRSASESWRLGRGELRQVVPLALLVHDQASALHFLAAVFPTTVDIRFTVAKAADCSVVSMHVVHRSVTFILSDMLFGDRQGEILLQRLIDVYPMLAYYLESPLRSDGTVAINLGDGGDKPGLVFCDNRPGYFLIPDAIFMDRHGYSDLRERFANDPLPWEKRSPIAFWRGTTTGQPLDSKRGWRSLPRVTLCEIGAANPDLIDAGITGVVQIGDPAAEAWVAKAGLLRPFVPPASFRQYKYQIDIDGNTTSWPGLFMKLLTGSVVLKVPPRDGFRQWYYDRLKPWVNFVPLAPDLSDLVEKVHWLQDNDDAARKIGEAGYRLAEDLTYEREVERAAPTVATAMKDASDLPLSDFDFSADGAGSAHLREGWLPPDATGVETAGFQSRLDLPLPLGIGGFIMRVDVSPAADENQRLAIAVDGELLVQQRISYRTTLYLPLARKILTNKAAITLTLLHPDAVPAASLDSPSDTRVLGIRLHRIAVLGIGRIGRNPQPGMAQALADLRTLDNVNQAQDLSGSPIRLPPSTVFLPLYTNHGTLAYADMATGRLRHGPADAVPHNLFTADAGGGVRLVRVTPDGQRWAVRFRPEGSFAAQADHAALDADGRVEVFTMVSTDGLSASRGLRAAGMVLCAEPSGDLALARVHIGGWELFRPTAEPKPSDHEELALSFESLGGSGPAGGCEFGFFQRGCGAEPLSLLRWAYVSTESLIACLRDRFEGIGSPVRTEIYVEKNRPDGLWDVRDKPTLIALHTFVPVQEVPYERMSVLMQRRLRFLRDKLVADLENPTKIFVHKSAGRHLTQAELEDLGRGIRSYGPGELLCVVESDAQNPPGKIEVRAPGVRVAYLDFSSREEYLSRRPAWLALCRTVLRDMGR